MVLLGQPELRQLLNRQNLRQLSQRITARYHLAPLGEAETFAYIKHRMKVAGAQQSPFSRSAMRALYLRSGGVPRLINIIADRALAGAYSTETSKVTARLVNAAASEVQPSEPRVRGSRRSWVIAAVSILVVLTIALQYFPQSVQREDPAEADKLTETVKIPAAAEAIPVRGVVVREKIVVSQAHVGGVTSAAEIPPALPTSLAPDWLESQHASVWQQLAGLWQDSINANAIQSACEGVSGTGYACLHDQGNWVLVEQLGLPVVLVLPGVETRYLLLRGITPGGVLVGDDVSMFEVSREAVDSQWLGEFIVPWPQAPDWPNEIRRGESGAAVEIVMDMARFAEPAWSGGGIFDAGFESWLMAFQRRHGLEADGIVGPNTLLYLMAPTISQPRLIVEDGVEDGENS
jgi:general secretion pathway protein A